LIRDPALVLLATTWVALTSGCSQSDLSSSEHLRFALASEFGGFDPITAGATTDQILQAQIYEGLCEYDPHKDDFSIRPLIAKSWSHSEDQLTWQFNLRSDVFFYDPAKNPLWEGGRRALVAQDIVYCWERARDPQQASSSAFVFDNLQTVRALDQHTIEVRLLNPDSNWLNRLASPYAVIYPSEAVERSSLRFADNPVGTAPYYLAEWEHPQRAVFKTTPKWQEQRAAAPKFSELEFIFVPESSTRSLMFKRGEIDRLPPLQDSFSQLIDGNQPSPELRAQGVHLIQTETPDLTMVMFNMNDPIVGNIPGDGDGNRRRNLLRKALAAAFPYQQWHKVLRDSVWATPARHILPPSMPFADDCESFSWRKENLDQAHKLLVAAGWPQGAGLPSLQLELGSAASASIDLGNIVKAAWARIGIDLQIVPQSRNQYYQKLNNGKAQIFTWAWSLDWPDPANILQVFQSTNAAPGINKANYKNKNFDLLLNKFRASQSLAQRQELTRELVAILGEDAPLIPIDHRRSWLLISPKLKLDSVNPFAPMPCRYFVSND